MTLEEMEAELTITEELINELEELVGSSNHTLNNMHETLVDMFIKIEEMDEPTLKAISVFESQLDTIYNVLC